MSAGDPFPLMPRMGWMCPKCGGAHSPDVVTCPADVAKTDRVPHLGPIYPLPPNATWWIGDPPGSVGSGSITAPPGSALLMVNDDGPETVAVAINPEVAC